MTRTRIVTAGTTAIMLAVVALTIYAVDEWWHSELRTKNVIVYDAESYMDIPNYSDPHQRYSSRFTIDYSSPLRDRGEAPAHSDIIFRNIIPNTATISLQRYEWSDWSPQLTCSDTN